MKKLFFIMLSMVLLLGAFPVQSVHAAENEKTYYLEWYWEDSKHVHITRRLEFTIPDDISVYAIFTKGGPSSIAINFLHDGDDITYAWEYSDHEFSNVHSNNFSHNDISIKNTQWWINASPQQSVGMCFSCGDDYITNLPLFDSKDSVVNYITNGNTDGWLNKPEVDYSGKHNFSNDEFLSTIPLPQLSSISHLGFTVDNLPDDMFIDVVAEFNFYGQHMKDDKYCTDYNWLYDSAQYDFTKSDFANNNPVITIKDFYDVNPIDVYWSFFEKWSAAYPNLKDIPGYAWYNFTLGSQYIVSNTVNDQIDYSTESGKLSQLIGSNALETVYYIRFYNDEGHAGQWMKFAYRDKLVSGLPVGSGSLISGAVSGSTPTGKPIVDTTINGDIDSDGNINFNPPTNDFTFNTDMDFSNFTYLLETSTNVLQQFPLFISQLFLFLPWWVNALIACAIAMCILLRIVGR